MSNYSEILVGFQDVEIQKVEKFRKVVKVHLQLKQKEVICPNCKAKTSKVHDYREQVIKDLDCFGKQSLIYYRKRRYHCTNCKKNFQEKNDIVRRYGRLTNRLIGKIYDILSEEVSYTYCAKQIHTSVNTVLRYFDAIQYPSMKNQPFPEAIGIDEFKGNADGEKYLGILVDLQHKTVIDILPTRKDEYLTDYFSKINTHERSKVKYFVSDMWKPYSELQNNFFKKSTYVVDRYHWRRQIDWALENIRKEEQKHLSQEKRLYFKHSKSLLLKPMRDLTDTEKDAVALMIELGSDKLRRAYILKEEFKAIYRVKDSAKAQRKLAIWMDHVKEENIPEMRAVMKTMKNWTIGILNSFGTEYSNGFTEGCNNKIKVLKRNAYGVRKFSRFRNRILHIFQNSKYQYA